MLAHSARAYGSQRKDFGIPIKFTLQESSARGNRKGCRKTKVFIIDWADVYTRTTLPNATSCARKAAANSPTLSSPPALPFGALLLIATAELRIVVVFLLLRRCRITDKPTGGRALSRLDFVSADKVAGVKVSIFVLLNVIAQALVARVDELVRSEARLVAYAGRGAGLEHHVHKGEAELALGRGLAVDPTNGTV
jgi:hypothetical protein